MKLTFFQWLVSAVLICGAVQGHARAQQAPASQLVRDLEAIFHDRDFASIPQRVFRAADFGAVADGKTVSTKALQSAIDAAHAAGGGVVTLSQGVTVSGALFLKSRVELRLEDGVVLQAVQDDAAYPDKWTRVAGIEMDWPAALINVYEQQDVRISGKGVIDGSGKYWWDKFWGDPAGKGGMMPDYEQRGLRWALDYDCKRVRPIVVYKSKNVALREFTVQRAGFWTISLTYSDRVHADGITIRNNIGGHGPSTDGVDIDSSSHVLVENCDVDCNDDNFCIKAGRDSDGLRVNRPSEFIVIRHCKTGKGHGLVTLGSETSGGMRHIEIYGLKAKGTATGFRLKSAKVRGGTMRDIWLHDVEMEGVASPFQWELNWFPSYSYPPRPKQIPESEWPAHWKVMLTEVTPPERGIPEFRDLRISNVKVTGAKTAIHANAYPEKPLCNVVWENVSIEAKSGGRINCAKHWTMTGVELRAENQVQLSNSEDVQLPELK
ncbi:MAG TPA: glycoside hydrolase family 28 protein [Luteolibacter sp.]|nr:glycoside hydrolase family 28 protein [Luteolibacter sp.]